MKLYFMNTLRKFSVTSLLLAAVLFSASSLQAALDSAKNNPMPESIAIDIADLLVLQDPAINPTAGDFAVRVSLYKKLLNLLVTDDATHAILYTDKIAPYITSSKDEAGVYSYSVVPGQEKTLLGYSKCLDAKKFRDVLCQNPAGAFTVDGQVHSNKKAYIYVKLGSTYTTPTQEGLPEGYNYYQWINPEGDYYWFSATNYENSSNGFDQSLTGEIWVGIKSDEPATQDWTVTGNDKDGLTTFTNGAQPLKVEEPASVTPTVPETPTAPTVPEPPTVQPPKENPTTPPTMWERIWEWLFPSTSEK